MLAQAFHLTCIVSKKFMTPSRSSFFAAILRHRPADFLVRAENGPEIFRFGPDTEDKDSVFQIVGNYGLRSVQPVFLTIEIDQQDHSSVWISNHSADVV